MYKRSYYQLNASLWLNAGSGISFAFAMVNDKKNLHLSIDQIDGLMVRKYCVQLTLRQICANISHARVAVGLNHVCHTFPYDMSICFRSP